MNDELKIGFRCQSSWQEMEGDDKTRFCTLCQKTVHNLCNLSEGEVKELILAKRRGQRICVRKPPSLAKKIMLFCATLFMAIYYWDTTRFRGDGQSGMLMGTVLSEETFEDFGNLKR